MTTPAALRALIAELEAAEDSRDGWDIALNHAARNGHLHISMSLEGVWARIGGYGTFGYDPTSAVRAITKSLKARLAQMEEDGTERT